MAARRYNKGKTRFALIPDKPLEYLAEVYTKGAHKYSLYKDEKGNVLSGKDIPLSDVHKYELIESGADNWRNGLPWMEAMDSIERHIRAFKNGEEKDSEIDTYHLANAAWGLFSLMEYYKTHPELDNRPIKALRPRRIGLDIDGVIADFSGHLATWFDKPGYQAAHWNDPNIRDWFEDVKKDEEFWATIPPLVVAGCIPFEPHCYLTARSVDPRITQRWLDENGFPKAPLICVGHDESKVEAAKKAGIEIFVDDRYENFVELTNAGIFTYLFDASYNRHYDCGHRRLYSLKDLK